MKRFFLLFITFIVASSTQAQFVSKNDQYINGLLGIVNFVRPSGFKTIIPPIQFQYERAVSDEITVGGYFGFATARFEDKGVYPSPNPPYIVENHEYRWNSTQISLGFKGAYHFGKLLGAVNAFDPYAGFLLGYNWVSENRKQIEGSVDLEPSLSPNPSSNGLFGVFVGARYKVSDKLSLMGELGYSTALFQLGVSSKL